MPAVCVRLFGKFCLQCGDRVSDGLDSRRVQELLCYLLLYRDRPHPRETLAGMLWTNASSTQSKTYLRKALWQLQTALARQDAPECSQMLIADAEWIQINPAAALWLDVDVLEKTFDRAKGVPGEEVDPQRANEMQAAVDLYRSDLLDGWYQDWCLYERERLQGVYLALLDKLMGYCEVHAEYEQGLMHGQQILRYDCAREQTHRRMMRLYCLSGDRTAALRQYERCVAVLSEELGVKPTPHTTALCEQIKANRLDAPDPPAHGTRFFSNSAAALMDAMSRLKTIQATLADLHDRVQQDIRAVEQAIADRR